MRLVALNEERAVYLPEGEDREVEPRAALNKLLTVHSWKAMLDFLKNEACCPLFAKRESDPLKNGLWTPEELQIDLTGSLKSRIDSDNEIDYLDELTERDLLSASKDELLEVWIPELLFYRDSFFDYLRIAAFAIGCPYPDDLFIFPDIVDVIAAEYIRDFLGDPSRYGCVGIDLSNTHKHDASYYDMLYDDDKFVNYDRYPDGLNDDGYLLTDFDDFSKDRDGQRYALIVYERSRYAPEEALRLLCGELVTIDLGRIQNVDVGDYFHSYVDEPDPFITSTFSLEQGFSHPRDDGSFLRWQVALFDVVEKAIFDGRIALCPMCGTPIVTRSTLSRTEYCCESHKTAASKRRRQTAHILYASGTPLEDAVAQIGEDYRTSIERWYAEAQRIAHPAP